MGTLKLVMTSSMSDDSLVQAYQRPTSAKYANVQALSDYMQKLNSGLISGPSGEAPSCVVSIVGNAVAASGTFTLTSVVATDAISINGVTFTAVASGATGNQFNVGVSDTATATNLAASINASATALVNTQVTASAATTVVTITADEVGYSGNAITIASADATIVASGARLTGGLPDADAKTYSF